MQTLGLMKERVADIDRDMTRARRRLLCIACSPYSPVPWPTRVHMITIRKMAMKLTIYHVPLATNYYLLLLTTTLGRRSRTTHYYSPIATCYKLSLATTATQDGAQGPQEGAPRRDAQPDGQAMRQGRHAPLAGAGPELGTCASLAGRACGSGRLDSRVAILTMHPNPNPNPDHPGASAAAAWVASPPTPCRSSPASTPSPSRSTRSSRPTPRTSPARSSEP